MLGHVTRFLPFLLHLLCLLGALVILQVWVPVCCVLLEHFFVFFVFFSCRFCLCLFLVLLLYYLRRPCGYGFCCFVALVCFAVGVRCAVDFWSCFVRACVCLVSCCLYMSRVNILVFAVVVARACLLCARAHTLVSTSTLVHALERVHILLVLLVFDVFCGAVDVPFRVTPCRTVSRRIVSCGSEFDGVLCAVVVRCRCRSVSSRFLLPHRFL